MASMKLAQIAGGFAPPYRSTHQFDGFVDATMLDQEIDQPGAHRVTRLLVIKDGQPLQRLVDMVMGEQCLHQVLADLDVVVELTQPSQCVELAGRSKSLGEPRVSPPGTAVQLPQSRFPLSLVSEQVGEPATCVGITTVRTLPQLVRSQLLGKQVGEAFLRPLGTMH
jgi:hypothetical protein